VSHERAVKLHNQGYNAITLVMEVNRRQRTKLFQQFPQEFDGPWPGLLRGLEIGPILAVLGPEERMFYQLFDSLTFTSAAFPDPSV
jgi:hypothetical protein